MYVRPDDVIRQHQLDLLDEACRNRRGVRVARASRLRKRAIDATTRAQLAAGRVS